MLERRKHSRVLTWKTGTVSISNHTPGIECAILDMSESGARILVPDTAAIPGSFCLMIDGSSEAYYCSVKWKRGARLGVQFQEQPVSARNDSRVRDGAISDGASSGSSDEACRQHLYPSSTSRELATMRFEDLPENIQALLFATLAREMSVRKSRTIYHLAKMWETDVTGAWRNICRKAGQSTCTIPVGVVSSQRRQVVTNP